jgi:hypothetical protein
MVAVWLIGTTGTDIAFVWYLIGITAVSLSVALTMPEPSPDLANVPTASREQSARAARASP